MTLVAVALLLKSEYRMQHYLWTFVLQKIERMGRVEKGEPDKRTVGHTR